ncbi:relaxase/mobilization nuclease domain-containing protein [Pedobacter chinensis]|nr:relaxase/mobilization nuclease domain-containing protein [Pedobacter chinensis]
MEKDKGELMLVSGFGALQGMDNLQPSDYINYLAAVTARSSKIVYPQLHVSISCKGQSHSKQQLTEIAAEWMKGMGYGSQPYIVVFHNDTANAHVHIVSTRIDRSGKKINDSFEKLKAYQVLGRIMAQDPAEQFTKDITEALAYNFSTRPQFAMLMEAKGYRLEMKGADYRLYKFGHMLGKVPLRDVDNRIAGYEKNKPRTSQLRAIVERYRLIHSGEVFPVSRPLPGGTAGPAFTYSSKLSEVLQQKFGLQVLYHGAPGKPPYGFSVIDHKEKMVLKGKELMDIRELISPVAGWTEELQQTELYPPIAGLDEPVTDSSHLDIWLAEPEVMPEPTWTAEAPQDQYDQSGQAPILSALEDLRLDISGDVDDEQILGPTRRRKRKARTNTR